MPTNNVYVRDLTTDTTTLVSATPGSQISNGSASDLAFRPDGQSLAYVSMATDLTGNPEDPNAPPGPTGWGAALPFWGSNVFLTDLKTGATTLESVTPSSQLSSGTTVNDLKFSPNGQYLAFTSNAGDLTNNAVETNPPPAPAPGMSGSYSGSAGGFGMSNVFVRNLAVGTTSLASATTGGLLPAAISGRLMFGADSGTLYFASGALDLTNNPPDGGANASPTAGTGSGNLFATNLATGTTTLVSATPSGMLSDATSTAAALSPDGKTVYFVSDADDLVPGGASTSTASPSANIFAATLPAATPNQIAFQSWATTAFETDGQAIVTVERSGPATGAASVDYAVKDGTAKAGTDYTATSGTLDFAPGQTSAVFTVAMVAGDTFTGNRSATLVLTDPQGGTLGQSSAQLDLKAMVPTTSPIVSVPVWPGSTPTATTPTTTRPATSTPKPTPSPSPSPTGTITRTPTATPSPTPSPTATAPAVPGPTVQGVAAQKGRRGIRSLVISFDKALDPARRGTWPITTSACRSTPRTGIGARPWRAVR